MREGSLCLLEDGDPDRAHALAAEGIRIARAARNIDLEMLGLSVQGAAANKTLAPGGYALMPANMNHFAYTARETTIVLYGQGPVEFKYVNPADDPRNARTATK